MRRKYLSRAGRVDANLARRAPARSTLIFHAPVNGDKVSAMGPERWMGMMENDGRGAGTKGKDA